MELALDHPKIARWLDRYPPDPTTSADYREDSGTWLVKAWSGEAGQVARGRRRGLDRTRHRGVDGPAGRLEDGARARGRVRREDAPQAVRVARVLPRLPARAGRSAAAALDAEPRPARASRLHGLARVLRPRRDLPQRPARLPGARVSAGPWALGRLRPALGSASVGLADVGARRCRGLPPRVPGRAQPRGASRCHRRRPRGCRRRRPDSRRRGAVREHAAARHARAVRPEGRGGTSTRAHPDERSLRGGDRARGHLRPGLLSRLRARRSRSSAGAGSGTPYPPRTRPRSRSTCSRCSRSC